MEFLIIWAICAGVCNGIAKAKNLNSTMWGFLGLFFGVFAVIAVLFAKSNTTKPETLNYATSGQLNSNLSSETDVERLTSLKKLLDNGVITQEDYEQQKAKILDS